MKFLKKISYLCLGTTTVYGAGAQIATNVGNISDLDDLTAGIDTDTVDSVGTITTKTGLAGVEKGDAAMHKTVLTLTNMAMTITDGSTEATDAAWGTQELYTFPVGRVVIHSAHAVFEDDAIVAGSGGITDTADMEFGIGTTARANQTNFALAAAEKNILPEKVMSQMVGGMSDGIETTRLASLLAFDGTTACAANLNFITSHDDDATAGDTLDITGVITIIWTMEGDD